MSDAIDYRAHYDTSPLIFPLDLRSKPERPVIEFSVIANVGEIQNHHSITFPFTHGGAKFSDGGDYGDISLGPFKAAMLAAAGAAMDKSGKSGEKFMEAVGVAGKQLSSTNMGDDAAFGLKVLGAEESTLNLTNFVSKRVDNPHAQTKFNGSKLRSFPFAFKLIASSRQETEVIRSIHRKFRHFVYGDATNDGISYPPVWRIRFLVNGEENKYIPMIYDCFLTDCDLHVNSSAPMFHYDGAPLEFDLSLSFTETRVLNRNDIARMEDTGERGGTRDYISVTDIRGFEGNVAKIVKSHIAGKPETFFNKILNGFGKFYK